MTQYVSSAELFLARKVDDRIIECYFVNQRVSTFKWEGGDNPTNKELLNATESDIYKVVLVRDKTFCLLPDEDIRCVFKGQYEIIHKESMPPECINESRMIPWLRIPGRAFYPGVEFEIIRQYCRSSKILSITRIEHLNESAVFELKKGNSSNGS